MEECIHALELLESKPFHATQSGLPGHVSDNQPIESLQKVFREFVGRKQHNPRSFFYNVLGRLMEHISRRLIVMSEQRPVFTVATMTGYEASMQLHALQAPFLQLKGPHCDPLPLSSSFKGEDKNVDNFTFWYIFPPSLTFQQ